MSVRPTLRRIRMLAYAMVGLGIVAAARPSPAAACTQKCYGDYCVSRCGDTVCIFSPRDVLLKCDYVG